MTPRDRVTERLAYINELVDQLLEVDLPDMADDASFEDLKYGYTALEKVRMKIWRREIGLLHLAARRIAI